MDNQPTNEEMSNRELNRDLQLMATAVTKMSESVSKLVESDIRRQERESRQEEFNNMARDRLHSLEDWKQDLEIKRATESQGREALKKYWPILVAVGSYIIFQVAKTGGFTL